MVYFIGFIVVLALVTMGIGQLRFVQLKRMAYTLGLRYDACLDTLLTPDNEQNAYFFHQDEHRFCQVLTFREAAAFMRVSQDRVYATGKAPMRRTLVTAELTCGTFTPLVLMPAQPGKPQTPHPALPPELAPRYELSAPDDFTLPQEVVGFLKAAKPCYLELTQTALIYHEFDEKPVSQIQPLRYRALQLLKAFVRRPEIAPTASAAMQELTQTNLDTTLLLKLQTASPTYTQAAVQPSGRGRWVYGVIFVVCLLAVCIFAGYALKHWVPR